MLSSVGLVCMTANIILCLYYTSVTRQTRQVRRTGSVGCVEVQHLGGKRNFKGIKLIGTHINIFRLADFSATFFCSFCVHTNASSAVAEAQCLAHLVLKTELNFTA